MSLYRSMGRGSWIVSRTLLGIHVRRATGIDDYDQAAEFERLLEKLAKKHGRRDLIEAFAQGRVGGGELLTSVEMHGVGWQLQPESTVRLRRVVYEWLTTVSLAEKTRKDYAWGMGILAGKLPPITRKPTAAEKHFLARGPVLRDLPALLSRYGRKRDTPPVMFVQVKAAYQSFVRHTAPDGAHSSLWRALAAIEGPDRKARDVTGGLTPARAREVAEALANAFDAVTGQVWWMLCCTGMEPKECWRVKGWQALEGRLQVRGTKTKQGFRVRWVPLIVTPVRPAVAIGTFRKRLHAIEEKVGIEDLTPYVARRTFAHFLELAQKVDHQILDSQCDLLMGHSPKTDRAKYREHDIIPYLPGIAKALRAVIGADPQYMRAMA